MAKDHLNKTTREQVQQIREEARKREKYKVVFHARELARDDKKVQLETATRLRMYLQTAHKPMISEMVNSRDFVFTLLELTKDESNPQLQFEAAWIVTNIAASNSENVDCLIVHGAVPILAAWAIGNIAGDSPMCRDHVLSHHALEHLAEVAPRRDFHGHEIMSWALLNLCRDESPLQFDQVKCVLRALACLLDSEDENVLTNVCRALSHISGGPRDKIQAIIDVGVCARLIELLFYPSLSILIATLRVIGNICTGDDGQTQVVIKEKTLKCLLNLLTHNMGLSVKKEAIWIISNITAGNVFHIQAIIEAGIFDHLIRVDNLKEEALWVIVNAICGGTGEQIKYLVGIGCIRFLCSLLPSGDTSVVLRCLQGLQIILKVADREGKTNNDYCLLIEEADGLQKIEMLQSHDNNEIYEKAVHILERYWSVDMMV